MVTGAGWERHRSQGIYKTSFAFKNKFTDRRNKNPTVFFFLLVIALVLNLFKKVIQKQNKDLDLVPLDSKRINR